LVVKPYGERGLAENVRKPSYGGRGLKLLKKPSYVILTFPIRYISVS